MRITRLALLSLVFSASIAFSAPPGVFANRPDLKVELNDKKELAPVPTSADGLPVSGATVRGGKIATAANLSPRLDLTPAVYQVDYGFYLPLYLETEDPAAPAFDGVVWRVVPSRATQSKLVLSWQEPRTYEPIIKLQGTKAPSKIKFDRAKSDVFILHAGEELTETTTVTVIALVPKLGKDNKPTFETAFELDVTFLPAGPKPVVPVVPDGGGKKPKTPDVPGPGPVVPDNTDPFVRDLAAAALDDIRNGRATTAQLIALSEVYDKAATKVTLTDPASSPARTIEDLIKALNAMSDAQKLPEKPALEATRNAIQARFKVLGYNDGKYVLKDDDRDKLSNFYRTIATTLAKK